MKIYISSTYNDLKRYRQAAIEIIEDYACHPVSLESLMIRPKEPEQVFDGEIRGCDIFVGIYAHQFGYCPKWYKKSIIQQEYELAKKLRKKSLFFIVAEDFPWDPRLMASEKRLELERFLSLVKKENNFFVFTTLIDFYHTFSLSLGGVLAECSWYIPKGRRLDIQGRLVPIIPTPYFPHPFPIPDDFVGRRGEMVRLSHWLLNKRDPVLVLNGKSGIGKTSLVWRWLQGEVIEKGVGIEGIFWWSLTEEPFETFIQHLTYYLMSGKPYPNGYFSQSDVLTQLYTLLHDRPNFLLIVDGFERVLNGCPEEAHYTHNHDIQDTFKQVPYTQNSYKQYPYAQITPGIKRFLHRLIDSQLKTLIISRQSLGCSFEDIKGVRQETLKGLTLKDLGRFLQDRGIHDRSIHDKGKGEGPFIQVCDGFSPCILKLLCFYFKNKGDHPLNEVLSVDSPYKSLLEKLLSQSYALLSVDEKEVATQLSVLRHRFDLNTARDFFRGVDDNQLRRIWGNLRRTGFLLRYKNKQDYEFHPVVREFLYKNLQEKESSHQKAIEYFKRASKSKKVASLKDLSAAIELYYHLTQSNRYEEAITLFREQLSKPIYYQFSNHALRIELLKGLFPQGVGCLPGIEKESSQVWALNALSISYSCIGQSHLAISQALKSLEILEMHESAKNMAIVLGNIAYEQIKVGRLSAAIIHLKKGLNLCWELEDRIHEATWHQEMGRILAYQGHSNFLNILKLWEIKGETCEREFLTAFEFWAKSNDVQGQVMWHVYQSLSTLMQIRLVGIMSEVSEEAFCLVLEAIEQACKALDYIDKDPQIDSSAPINLVLAYWLLGEALIRYKLFSKSRGARGESAEDTLGENSNNTFKRGAIEAQKEAFSISFYNVPDNKDKISLSLGEGKELDLAARCLRESLYRCRNSNLVELEPNILISLALLSWINIQHGAETASAPDLSEIEETLKDAYYLAECADYRLTLADLHLLCAEILSVSPRSSLLGFSFARHIDKAKEYSLDISEFSDLFSSKDPDFFEGIEEFEMLRHGLDQSQKIEQGYYISYKIADLLEAKLKEEVSEEKERNFDNICTKD